MGIILAASTNTLVKGVLFAWFVGFRESRQLLLLMLLAVILGLLTAYVTGLRL